MKKLYFFTVLLCFTSILSVLISCSENKKPQKKEKEQSLEVENIKNSENVLLDFFELSKNKDYETCYTYFSDSLKDRIEKNSFIKIMEKRNTEHPNFDSISVYFTQITSTEAGDIYTFYSRIFSKSELVFYEKISVFYEANLPKILDYDYSENIYYTVKMANTTNSDLQIFLQNTYETANSGNAEKFYSIIDTAVKEQINYSKFELGFNKVKLKYKANSSFSVKSIWTEILQNVPVLNIVVEASNYNGDKFLDKILISDRNGKYYIADIDRDDFERAELLKIERPSDSELSKFAEFTAEFYEFLKTSNFYEIMKMIDRSVFVNNDYEIVKSSFLQREQHYGRPKTLKNTLVKAYSLGTKTIVEFNFDVENTNGIISYEKIQISKTPENKFSVFSYDYRAERF
ncbi:MAG: hypothetical protein RBR32_04540 [Bacteroidales bacterium]|nr:hypothetical protein [Bacteroidales bacterium]